MNSTISAVMEKASQFNWGGFINNPFVQYIASPTIVFLILGFIFTKAFRLGELKEKIFAALDDIKDLKKGFKKLSSHVDIIRASLVTKGGLDARLFSSTSPLKLLPEGEKLLESSGFKKIYNENKKWFVNEIKKYNVKTLADVDEASFEIMEKSRDNRKFADFKEIAFQNGVTLDLLLRVLSIHLRDQIANQVLDDKDK